MAAATFTLTGNLRVLAGAAAPRRVYVQISTTVVDTVANLTYETSAAVDIEDGEFAWQLPAWNSQVVPYDAVAPQFGFTVAIGRRRWTFAPVAAGSTLDLSDVTTTFAAPLNVGGGGGATSLDDITDLSAFAATLLDDADAPAARATLGAAALQTNNVDLAGVDGYATHYRIIDDGTSTGSWPDRWQIEYVPATGGADVAHLTSWFNEYGEFRVTPGKRNTIPLRVFVGELPADWTDRDMNVAVFEIVSDRNNRVQKFAVQPNGQVLGNAGATFLADVTAPNIGKKVVTWPTGTEPSLVGVPDGTLWVEFTP